MAQEQVQIQTQKQQQVQRLSQQQMLQVKLLEMPLTELEESVNAELDDNPALEAGGEETDSIDDNDTVEHSEDDDFDTLQEREERQDALDSALERMRSDDDLPTYDSRQQRNNAEYEEIVYGDTTSFIDKLNEQVGERELTERQKSILEYLIGSLDDDGLLRKDLDSISDELAICSMEYIYFARPDSNIHGVNVHTARKRMGAQLAREFKHEADIVVGVPNSSLSAAMGFAEESGLPNEMGLIKNQYTQRTFIQPTQELREQGVRMKLSAVSGVINSQKSAWLR